MSIYRDRIEAGKKLAAHLTEFERRDNLVVLALPRGGVPVAYEVARALDVPMDVFVVRKLGMPGHQEFAMGAIASGGIRVINAAAVHEAGITEKEIDAAAAQEQLELERRERLYRGDRPRMNLREHTVMVVDDGMATGSTMHAAVLALRRLKPSEIIVAVPVASVEACAELKQSADRVICLNTPAFFRAVGQWYDDFSQTTDAEVLAYMDKAAKN